MTEMITIWVLLQTQGGQSEFPWWITAPFWCHDGFSHFLPGFRPEIHGFLPSGHHRYVDHKRPWTSMPLTWKTRLSHPVRTPGFPGIHGSPLVKMLPTYMPFSQESTFSKPSCWGTLGCRWFFGDSKRWPLKAEIARKQRPLRWCDLQPREGLGK